MRFLSLTLFFLSFTSVFGQNMDDKLSGALKDLQTDVQFKHAIISMYLINSKTGKLVFEQNGELGLAPASCQKVVTSASALSLLGGNFSYLTEIGLYGNKLQTVYVKSSGDPTLGSWRWQQTGMDTISKHIIENIRKHNLKNDRYDLILDESIFGSQATPNGWTWDDIGNYYGAGARAMNWHENQYDLILQPGKKIGDPVKVIATEPKLLVDTIINELRTGASGSGDNSVIYLPENGRVAYLRGTIPSGKETFTISGSMPNGANSFIYSLTSLLGREGLNFSNTRINYDKDKVPSDMIALNWIKSPPLDSINYWFLKRSVNLYGEALVKTIGYNKGEDGTTEAGLNIIKDFWEKNGIDRSSLHIIDGSGLSPANRITTHALVQVMQYAKQQSWFPSFYLALPELNGIKMKDGYIGGVRSFTGYVKGKDGTEYTFSFIVNNFDGSAGTVREKMWKVLDLLK